MIKYSYRKYFLDRWPNATAIDGQLERYMQRANIFVSLVCELKLFNVAIDYTMTYI